jgi:hypothetical protein
MKYTTVVILINALNKAYKAACKGLGIANKLGRNDLKGRIMGNMNKIRAELKKYSALPLFMGVAYNGAIVAVIK